jgi:hypothetical protein
MANEGNWQKLTANVGNCLSVTVTAHTTLKNVGSYHCARKLHDDRHPPPAVADRAPPSPAARDYCHINSPDKVSWRCNFHKFLRSAVESVTHPMLHVHHNGPDRHVSRPPRRHHHLYGGVGNLPCHKIPSQRYSWSYSVLQYLQYLHRPCHIH